MRGCDLLEAGLLVGERDALRGWVQDDRSIRPFLMRTRLVRHLKAPEARHSHSLAGCEKRSKNVWEGLGEAPMEIGIHLSRSGWFSGKIVHACGGRQSPDYHEMRIPPEINVGGWGYRSQRSRWPPLIFSTARTIPMTGLMR